MYRMPPWVRWPRLLLVSFCLGALTDFWLAERLQRARPASIGGGERVAAAPIATTGRGTPLPGVAEVPAPGGASASPAAGDIEMLRERRLTVPVDGADVDRWKGSFDEVHSGHKHEAVDILAPKRSPVHAVEAGSIGKLFTSKAGGLTIYQFDPTRRFVYYYAHLDSYEPGLHEGDAVAAGQVIGYVGTTGNSPPETPHLHFAISRLQPGEGWWQGTAIDPVPGVPAMTVPHRQAGSRNRERRKMRGPHRAAIGTPRSPFSVLRSPFFVLRSGGTMLSDPSRALALVMDVHGGEPWHSYSTRRILEGVDAAQAATRPGGGAHSIWEIVLHMTAWTHEVAARLRGGEPGEPAEGDFPAVSDTTEAEWLAALAALDAAQQELTEAVEAVPDGRWHERVGTRNAALGTGKTHLETLEGLAVHHGYHAGQIALLKRILS